MARPAPRHRQAALAPHVVANADGREARQRRGGRPPDLLQGAAPEAGRGRPGLGGGGVGDGGGVRAQAARGDPSSAAPPPGRGARARAARGAAGGRRGVRHERPARGVAVDVLAAQDVRGELMLEAAEEAPELRFRAHELRAAGHEELEGVAQRLRAAGQRQLRSRVHHLLLQRLQPGGPSFRSVAAAPGGPGPAPPPLHAASHRRPLGAARRLPPAPRLRGAARCWRLPPRRRSLLFSRLAAPPPRGGGRAGCPAARLKMATAGAHPGALSLDGARPLPGLPFLLLSRLLSPSAFL